MSRGNPTTKPAAVHIDTVIDLSRTVRLFSKIKDYENHCRWFLQGTFFIIRSPVEVLYWGLGCVVLSLGGLLAWTFAARVIDGLRGNFEIKDKRKRSVLAT